MQFDIEKLSNEERSALFPISLSEYNPNWCVIYEKEKNIILESNGQYIENIFHFGSTAIPDLIAKPVIDVLVILNENAEFNLFVLNMESAGFICSKRPDKDKQRRNCMFFVKGYSDKGYIGQAIHVHIREYGSDTKELLFCRYLREHPDVAVRYGELKLSLVDNFKNDREAYTASKNEFIDYHTSIAIRQYSDNE